MQYQVLTLLWLLKEDLRGKRTQNISPGWILKKKCKNNCLKFTFFLWLKEEGVGGEKATTPPLGWMACLSFSFYLFGFEGKTVNEVGNHSTNVESLIPLARHFFNFFIMVNWGGFFFYILKHNLGTCIWSHQTNI